jgi:hypothetical protein
MRRLAVSALLVCDAACHACGFHAAWASPSGSARFGANIADSDGDWQRRWSPHSSSPSASFTTIQQADCTGCELTFVYQEHDALGRG